jgi:hypothetical protein
MIYQLDLPSASIKVGGFYKYFEDTVSHDCNGRSIYWISGMYTIKKASDIPVPNGCHLPTLPGRE